MLSVAKIGNSGGAASYYEAEDNYYDNPDFKSEWFGKGAEILGLAEQQVDNNTFKNVLDGQLPDQSNLSHMVNGKNKHRAGYDLTFSAPKSVSVLALVEGDNSVLEAHKEAVKKTLNEIETLVSTRTMENGVPDFEETGNFVAALFLHDTNRNLDPQLHTHAVIANITHHDEKGWKTLSTDKFGTYGFVETVFKNQVALGAIYRQYLKEDLAKQGYEFVDAGKNGLWEIKGVPTDIFSTRRQEILNAVGEDASAKSLSVATKDTRQPKILTDISEIREEWKERLAETGFNKSEILKNEGAEPSKMAVPVKIENAVKQSIVEMEGSSVKFAHDALLTKVVNKVAVHQGTLAEIKQAISSAIERGDLIATDKHQSYFTTPKHLESERDVSALISKIDSQKNEIESKQQSLIGNHIAAGQKNFNLFSIRGNVGYEQRLISDIDQLAQDNHKHHVIIVGNHTDKKQLSGDNVYTVKDYLALANEHQNKLVTIYRSEKIALDDMKAIFTKSYINQDTVSILDTGTRKNTGLTRDLASSLGIEAIQLNENNAKKNLVILENVDKAERLRAAADLYTKISVHNKSVVVQVGTNKLKEEMTNRIRQDLTQNGLLSERATMINTRKSIYLDGNNRNQRNTYKVGYLLEKQSGDTKTLFKVAKIDNERNRLILVDPKGQVSALSVNKIDSGYKAYQEKALEIRVGEKLKSTQSHHALKGKHDLTVVNIKKGNFLFSERVVVKNSAGKEATFSTKEVLNLEYNYAEHFGASTNKQHVISVLNKNETNAQTINQVKRSSDSAIFITGSTKQDIAKNVSLSDSQLTVTDSLNRIYAAQNLNQIKQEALKSNKSDLEKVLNLNIEKATLATKNKIYFNGLTVLSQVVNQGDFTLAEAKSALEQRIDKGDFISIGGTKSLNENFIPKATFEHEVNILKTILVGKNAEKPIADSGKINLEGLTSGQKDAARMILGSTDRVMMIQGYAGVGKTTQFKTVAKAIAENRPDLSLVGLAPTHKAVSELNHAGIKSQTIASFLTNLSNTNIEAENKTQFKNTVFVVDESSMVGNHVVSDLLSIITQSGGRVILSGDKDQLKSFDGGTPFALSLERSSADKSIMSEIVRQNPALKPAVEAIIRGNVAQSLEVIEKNIPGQLERKLGSYVPDSAIMDLKREENPYQRIAQDYSGRVDEIRQNTLVITPMNADRKGINTAIHQELSDSGMLSEKSTEIPILERINTQVADLKNTHFWADNISNIAKIGNNYYVIDSVQDNVITLKHGDNQHYVSTLDVDPRKTAVFNQRTITVSEGEKLRITATDKERTANNNDVGTVTNIQDGKITLEIGERSYIYEPSKDISDRHLDYGYTVTAYASQGASVQYGIIYDGVENGKKALSALDNTYVEISRFKEHVQLYVDDKKAWIDHVQTNTGERLTAHDVVYRVDDYKAKAEAYAWDGATELSNSKLYDKLPEMVAEIGRYVRGKSEVLLPVVNENGVQRGNYHLPVSTYTGQLDYEKGYYAGAKDGVMIVVNRGDEQQSIKNYALSDMQQAITTPITDTTMIITVNDSLDNIDKNETIQPVATEDQIASDLIMTEQDKKALEETIYHELVAEDKNKSVIEQENIPAATDTKDNLQDIIDLEKTIDNDKAMRLDIIIDEVKSEQSIDNKEKVQNLNDEVNILRHKENTDETLPQKQKEYGS
ncbi:conjugative relaxase [Testudinibacter sp. TR-2022]|uniref:MobF family relaxase n=1 Tax=Testudinibacter sp. TR-2022 TaxID=2585029 RepID=UPI001117E9AF|nr:MobF family relaxase [Testudinibacter sp. TR-2022]TNH04054.1 conjugative relaxase [Pasteurellaceae bacterium Phil31]TNH10161.1 conjugative relaxase [Testudinibacter sp. TR-2022]TNH13021.1 conjugative relaxase [Testudinibacter sp. TR-2022]